MFRPINDSDRGEIFVQHREGGAAFVLVPLALSNNPLRVVSLWTELEFFYDPNMSPSGLIAHLFFKIIVQFPHDDGETFETMDREIAAKYLPDGVRERVMDFVLASIDALVDAVKPTSIYRVAKVSGVPEKALTKHTLVTNRLVELGYDVAECAFDGFGRPFWLMRRA